MNRQEALVIGANSDIGQSVASALKETEEFDNIHLVSRKPITNTALLNSSIFRTHICDNKEDSIKKVLEEIFIAGSSPCYIVICNGILHSNKISPERRLEHISSNSLEEIFRINAIVPILWLSELINHLSNTSPSVVAVLSARVGSITDNKLGGWYSYRASKAALNMLLKTAAIEYSRRNRMVKILSLHPGTVDTKLSKPFQRSIPKEQIFTPDYAASRLLTIMKSIAHDGKLDYLDWEGKKIPW